MDEGLHPAIDDEIENRQATLKNVDPVVRKKVMDDALKMKDRAENLPTDFCDGSNNKKAVAVIINHYETKIKALQTIITFMKENEHTAS
jgi:hypothetical protein